MRILRIQIPKTANISRNTLMVECFGAIAKPYESDDVVNPRPWVPDALWNTDRDQFLHLWATEARWEDIKDASVVGWHDPKELYDSSPYSFDFVMSWVREPVAHTISSWYFFGLNQGLYPKTPTLEEYITLPNVVNRQTMYLRNLDEYDFIGVVERIDQDFAYLARKLNMGDAVVPHKNRGLQRQHQDILARDPGIRKLIEQASPLDFELYEQALSREYK
jgi:hypothetical protein